MHRNLLLIFSGCLLAFALASCAKTETPSPSAANNRANTNAGPSAEKTPPADVVRANASEVALKQGGKAEASVRLSIANGYHINANPASAYQIATELKVEAGDGLTPDTPIYPASLTKKFSFSDKPLAVYEGEVVIRLPLRADSNATKGARKVPAKLRIQACDEEVCYQPRTIDVSIPVTIN